MHRYDEAPVLNRSRKPTYCRDGHRRYDLGDNARAGTVVVVDTESQEIVKVIEIDGYGSGLGAAVPN